MDLSQLARGIAKQHKLTEAAIAKMLNDRGVKVTQPTINRIKNGVAKDPPFSIGYGLMQLQGELSKVRPRKVA